MKRLCSKNLLLFEATSLSIIDNCFQESPEVERPFREVSSSKDPFFWKIFDFDERITDLVRKFCHLLDLKICFHKIICTVINSRDINLLCFLSNQRLKTKFLIMQRLNYSTKSKPTRFHYSPCPSSTSYNYIISFINIARESWFAYYDIRLPPSWIPITLYILTHGYCSRTLAVTQLSIYGEGRTG